MKIEQPPTSTPLPRPKESPKEVVISVIIAFVLAFVFRTFIAEAFVIPTGSMAPTLNGAHVRINSPASGADWAINPHLLINGDNQNPYPEQGTAWRNGIPGMPRLPSPTVHDPILGTPIPMGKGETRAGDRIFVLKFLYGISEPKPFDVVVFKNPTDPDQNYIKRLIGIPGEQVALIDGDIFIRPTASANLNEANLKAGPWSGEGWKIRRKPTNVQRAVWQPVYDSSYTRSSLNIQSPWVTSGGITSIDGGFAFLTPAPSAPAAQSSDQSLTWDSTKPFIQGSVSAATRAITDRYAYNEIPSDSTVPGVQDRRAHYPVSDLRIRANLAPAPGTSLQNLVLRAVITGRGHDFAVDIQNGKATLSLQPIDSAGQPTGTRTNLASGSVSDYLSDHAARFEFWHVDQSLQLWIDDRLVLSAEYNWSPTQRLVFATTPDVLQGLNQKPMQNGMILPNPLADATLYKRSGATLTIGKGSPQIRLSAVGLDRDLFYRPDSHPQAAYAPTIRDLAGTPAMGTHPTSTITLKQDQFFVCGDNSPASLDGRLWGHSNRWVEDQLDTDHSIVPRRLMLGKAFFVYFPAPHRSTPIMPDFGRMRRIQ